MKTVVLICSLLCAVWVQAQAIVAVRLYDMYGTEAVKLMSREEFNELRAEIAEEKKVFRAAFAQVKKNWEKKRAAAIKMGDKSFPKFPSGNFVKTRYYKEKTINGQDNANAWLSQNQGRINGIMAAQAAATEQHNKSASGALISGYSGRDDKRAKKKAEKAEMKDAVIEHLREEVSKEMTTRLKYHRPIPVHFIYDPVAGGSKQIKAKVEEQEAAMEAYRKRKAAGDEEPPAPVKKGKAKAE